MAAAAALLHPRPRPSSRHPALQGSPPAPSPAAASPQAAATAAVAAAACCRVALSCRPSQGADCLQRPPSLHPPTAARLTALLQARRRPELECCLRAQAPLRACWLPWLARPGVLASRSCPLLPWGRLQLPGCQQARLLASWSWRRGLRPLPPSSALQMVLRPGGGERETRLWALQAVELTKCRPRGGSCPDQHLMGAACRQRWAACSATSLAFSVNAHPSLHWSHLRAWFCRLCQRLLHPLLTAVVACPRPTVLAVTAPQPPLRPRYGQLLYRVAPPSQLQRRHRSGMTPWKTAQGRSGRLQQRCMVENSNAKQLAITVRTHAVISCFRTSREVAHLAAHDLEATAAAPCR